ncbi:MAG: tetratricopeptide repeat protein, partial [Gemmatimonadales bacterium]
LSGLRVISRTSAGHYRNTAKPLKEIGRELGAAYVLEGSVRWERGVDGPGRIRVTPQLIRVADDVHLWAEGYDAELGAVFQLQTTIAERVAGALAVTLGPSQRAALDEGGTSDPDAYDFYLRGSDYLGRGNARATLAAARELYEKAVARDPQFALAWARLSSVYTQTYWYDHDRSAARLALARRAADSAFALAPNLAEVQIALGYYYYRAHRDYARALEHFEAARRRQPANGDLLAGIAAVDRRQGRWDRAVRGYSEALRYDPLSNVLTSDLAYTLAFMHRFSEAERAYDRAITLAPDWASPYVDKASLYLAWRGDLGRARSVLAEAMSRIGFEQLAPWLISNDQITSTILTSDSASAPLVDALTLQGFPGDTMEYYFIKAESARFRGLAAAERAYADSLRTALEHKLRARPDDPDNLSWLGIAYAALGRKADAERAARRAVELLPVTKDALVGPYLIVARARVYMMLGEPERAIATLEPMLAIPSPVTREALRADPLWTPLRERPRFRTLVAEVSGPRQ